MANYQYVEQTGVIIADTADLLTQVQNEYKAVWGQDLDVSPSTPQGMQIAAEVIARNNVIRNNAALANQINPTQAGGVFLDALWALTGGERSGDTHSVVSVDATGVASTSIPAGALKINNGAGGEIFESISIAVIGVDGTVSVLMQAVNFGAIAAPADTLTVIVEGVLGVETVNNPLAAVVGTSEESDEASRAERKMTLALQGSGTLAAILAGVYNTPDVRSARARENYTNGTLVIDGVTMVEHSIYVCVDGGTDNDVAEAIIEKKDGGANYNNGASVPVSVDYIEPASGQTYVVLFDRPTIIDVVVRATVRMESSIADPIASVTQAIEDYANGLIDGEPGLTVGTSVSCFELAGAVTKELPEIFVQNMEISLASPLSYSNNTIPIAIYEKAVITLVQVIVVP